MFQQMLNGNNVMEAIIATGKRKGDRVLIPRVRLYPEVSALPYAWMRCQFPVQVAFAMTINKAQGQSLATTGVYLPEPVFGHGQLYVAASRASSRSGLRFCIKPPPGAEVGTVCTKTRNIVWHEVFSQNAGLAIPYDSEIEQMQID